ncbi:hypothetical protein RIF29_28894 [Crotalaria pallida]|uniref:Uncharacterized protein n=1 Tax=Crotalaria pallida TaxID=3830 RepID=A0AAN9EEG3_CROPI
MGDFPKKGGSGSRFNALVEEDVAGEESGATGVNGGDLKYQLGSSKGVKFRNPLAGKNKQELEKAKLISHSMKEKEKEILHKMQVLQKQGINGLDHMVTRVQFHFHCINSGSVLSKQPRQADGAGSSGSMATEPLDKEEDEETGPAMEIDALGAKINLQRKIENQSVTLGLEGQPSSLLQ